jgi:predicted Zn-dependent protease
MAPRETAPHEMTPHENAKIMPHESAPLMPRHSAREVEWAGARRNPPMVRATSMPLSLSAIV